MAHSETGRQHRPDVHENFGARFSGELRRDQRELNEELPGEICGRLSVDLHPVNHELGNDRSTIGTGELPVDEDRAAIMGGTVARILGIQ